MRPSLANGVQACSTEEERPEIAPGACATTESLAQIANTAPARIPIALMPTDFRATNKRIASSLERSLERSLGRPIGQDFFLFLVFRRYSWGWAASRCPDRS